MGAAAYTPEAALVVLRPPRSITYYSRFNPRSVVLEVHLPPFRDEDSALNLHEKWMKNDHRAASVPEDAFLSPHEEPRRRVS